MVDGMLWRTAGKFTRYAGELVIPDPLDTVRRHLPFLPQPVVILSTEFCARWSRLQLVSLGDGIQTGQQ